MILQRIIGISILLMLSSCANYSAVKQFSKAGQQLTSTISSMNGVDVQSCKNMLYLDYIYTDDNPNSDEALLKSADHKIKAPEDTYSACQHYEDSAKGIYKISEALGLYYKKLEEVSDQGISTSFDDDINGLSDAAKKIPNANTKTISSAESIAKFIAQIIISAKQEQEVENALKEMDSVNELLSGLKLYIDAYYKARLQAENTKREIYSGFYLKTVKSAQDLHAEYLWAQDDKKKTKAEITHFVNLANTQKIVIERAVFQYENNNKMIAANKAKLKATEELSATIPTMIEQNNKIRANFKNVKTKEAVERIGKILKQLKSINDDLK